MHFSLIFVFLFHTQSSYFLGPVPLIFSEAEAYCVSQSYHLASVHSSSAFYEARRLCETVTNPEACWTGLQRVGTSDVWTYTDGSALDFGFDPSGSGVAIQGQLPPWIFSGGPFGPQPDGIGNNEPCVEFVGNSSHVFYDFYWNDRRCDHANYPICGTSTTYPNCAWKKKYATTWSGVGKTWTNWYDGKVRKGRNEFLAEYPSCHTSAASSLEFFYQFVYDESARTLTFYAQFCCGTDKQFGSDYRVTWVANGYGSKSEYEPNPAWVDHNTPLYDYTCNYKKNYEITLPDTVWATWQNYCNKWIKKGRDAFLDEKPWCGYEDSLEFFYRFSYNTNAKQLTFYGHFCCGKENGKSLQFGAEYTKSGKIPNSAWYDHNPWAYEQECIDQTDWA